MRRGWHTTPAPALHSHISPRHASALLTRSHIALLCLAGVHRSLGVHNSKVRSTNLDTWLPEQVAFVAAVGNARGNAYWEAALPRDAQRPAEADMAALRSFINDKYVHRAFCSKDLGEPPSTDNYQQHPVSALCCGVAPCVVQVTAGHFAGLGTCI